MVQYVDDILRETVNSKERNPDSAPKRNKDNAVDSTGFLFSQAHVQ